MKKIVLAILALAVTTPALSQNVISTRGGGLYFPRTHPRGSSLFIPGPRPSNLPEKAQPSPITAIPEDWTRSYYCENDGNKRLEVYPNYIVLDGTRLRVSDIGIITRGYVRDSITFTLGNGQRGYLKEYAKHAGDHMEGDGFALGLDDHDFNLVSCGE